MEKYYIHQKGKFRRTFEVKDFTGTVLYTAKMQVSPISNKFNVFDRTETKVAEIVRKISFIVPKFGIRIKSQGEEFSIKRKIGFCVEYVISKNQQIVLTSSDCNRYFVCNSNRDTVYEIAKDIHLTSHDYVLQLDNGEDCLEPFCVAVALDASMRAISRVN